MGLTSEYIYTVQFLCVTSLKKKCFLCVTRARTRIRRLRPVHRDQEERLSRISAFQPPWHQLSNGQIYYTASSISPFHVITLLTMVTRCQAWLLSLGRAFKLSQPYATIQNVASARDFAAVHLYHHVYHSVPSCTCMHHR